MSITGIYLRISIHTQYHLQVISSIQVHEITYFIIHTHSTLFLVVYTSALFGSLALTDDLPPASPYRGLGAGGQTAPRVQDLGYRRRALHLRLLPVRRTSAHV